MDNNFLNNYQKKAEDTGAKQPGKAPQNPQQTQKPIEIVKETQPKQSEQVPQNSFFAPSDKGESGFVKLNKEAEPTAEAQSEEKPANNTMSFSENNGFVMAQPKPSFMGDPNAKKKLPIPYIVGGGIALLVIILIIYFLTRGAAVPDMETWAYSQATLWSNENGVLINKEEEYSDTIPASTVISQSPAAGEVVGGDDVLTLVVSKGPDLSIMVPVPDLMNMTLNEVEAWAEENLMSTVRITTEESETVAQGKMIEYTINDNSVIGTEIRRDSPLYIIFSKGQGEGEAIEVPNFLTMSTTEAQEFADDNKIVLETVEEFSETIAKGQIIRQSIKAKETVYEGNTITIYVSKGEEVRVPNFSNISKDMAEREAAKEGVTVVITEKYVMNVDEGKFVSQSMAAGSLYEDGDYVEIVYSLGYRVLVPSFVGQHEEAIRTWIDEYNELGASFSVSSTFTESSQPYGTVLAQTKEFNTMDITAVLEFVISKGSVIYAPDFVAGVGSSYGADGVITREEAIIMCDALGIVAQFVEESTSGRKPGEVWWQSIAPATQMKEGDVIVLKYQPMSSAITVPNFVGQLKTAVEADASLNFAITYVEVPYVDDATVGKISSQSVTAGTSAVAGTAITLEYYGEKPPVESTPAPATPEPATPTPAP